MDTLGRPGPFVFDSRLVGVFIGANFVGALRQLDIREPKEREPYGVYSCPLVGPSWEKFLSDPTKWPFGFVAKCHQIGVDGNGGSDFIEQF